MTTNAIIYEGSKADRCIRDFEHRLDSCSAFTEIHPNLLEVVQKTIGASCIVLFPLYRGAVPKPDVVIHSEQIDPKDYGKQTVMALPIAVKEFGPLPSFLEDKRRTRNLVEHFGRHYFETSQTYNEVLRQCRVKHSIAAIMGTKQHPLGFIGLSRSSNEIQFTDKEKILTDSIRTATERALARVAQLNDEFSLGNLESLGRRLAQRMCRAESRRRSCLGQ